MIAKITLAGLVMMFPLPAVGQAGPATATLVGVALDQEALKTLLGRKALITAVGGYCTEIANVFPRNSPDEDRWLDGEVRGEGSRSERILRSAELGRRKASNLVASCATWLAEINKNPESIRSFIGLSYTFLIFSDDSDYFAKQNGLNADRLGLPFVPRAVTQALLFAALMIG